MSIERLKEVRDEVIATGHGLYLESTQKLLAAIEEHILQPVKSATKKVKEEAASAEVATEFAVGTALGDAFESR